MERTKTTCMEKIFGTLAFTFISAVSLIIAGIVLSSIQETEIVTESHNHKNETSLFVDYANCIPVQLKFNSCEEVIVTQSSCHCDIDFNLDQNLQGKIAVYTQIKSLNEVDSTFERLLDRIEDTFKECNLSTFEKSTPDFYCKPIPDDIFNDIFTLRMYNSSDESVALAHFSKSNSSTDYLKMDYENLKNRVNQTLRVSMETDSKNIELENGLIKGKYNLKMTYRPRIYENTTRKIVFSTEHMVTVTTTNSKISGPNIIGIVTLVVGIILGVLSFVIYILRKRIPGLKKNNVTNDPTNNVSPNSRHLEALAEEKPLSSTNNDT